MRIRRHSPGVVFEQLAKCPDETCLIGKSAFERDLDHGQAGMQQKFLGCVNALLQKPAVGGCPWSA